MSEHQALVDAMNCRLLAQELSKISNAIAYLDEDTGRSYYRARRANRGDIQQKLFDLKQLLAQGKALLEDEEVKAAIASVDQSVPF